MNRIALSLSVLALLCTLAGPLSAQEGTGDRELVVAYSPKQLVLDPHRIYTTMEAQLSTALYEGLLSYHPYTLQPIPGVAYDWEESQDKTVYRFFLRQDARFSNGDPVRAQDFRDSWLRALDPALGAEYSFLFDVIQGARDYRLGRSRSADSVGIRVISDKELEVRLEKPASHFLKLLCHMSFAPVHPSYLKRKDWDQASTIIGNGPFYLQNRTPGELRLRKNPYYWDARDVELDALRVRFMADAAAISRAFNEGQIQWADTWDTELLEEKDKIVVNPLFATSYFFFVCAQKPWKDERVRKGLSLLLPWEQIRSSELILPTSTLVPAITGYPEVKGIQAPDREAALALLAEAGYPQGRGLPPLTVKLPESSGDERVVQLMSDTWRKELGLQVKVLTFPYDRYLQEVRKADFALGTSTWIGDYADPLTFLQMWTTESNLNDAHFNDPEFDGLLDSCLGLEGEARYQGLAKSEELLLQKAVVLPISHTPAFNLIDLDRVEGWFPNVLDIHPFKYLRFKALRLPPGVARLPDGPGAPATPGRPGCASGT
jgi:oligopeptide transport system substrate-binding protein